MEKPIITIICLCYNQEKFVEKAIQSVFDQTYPFIQLIVIDDASTDDSKNRIQSFLKSYPQVKFILSEKNKGNCAAFNLGFQYAKGKYIIDFAADDVMLPDRIEKQVFLFEQLDEKYGVVFSDVELIDENEKKIKEYYKKDRQGKLIEKIPQGDIYQKIIERNFISSPSMMVRKKVLDEMNGYDETLSYEDFDFWIRSSRNYWYAFSDEILTQKRIVHSGLHKEFYKKNNELLRSTYLVCEKIFQLNKTQEEHQALVIRIRHHMRQAFFMQNRKLVRDYFLLLKKIIRPSWKDYFWYRLSFIPLPVYFLYRMYLRIRFGIKLAA